MGHIPAQLLENLEKYSYKGVDKSLLSRYVLSHYWNWLITLWPRYVAPNTVRRPLKLCSWLTAAIRSH